MYLCTKLEKIKTIMDNKNELAVFHARSTQGVISAGYKLYMANFRKLLRSSWVVAIIYALCMGVLGSYYIAEMPQLTVLVMSGMTATDPTIIGQIASSGLILTLLTVAFIGMATVLASCGFTACKEHLNGDSVNAPTKWYGHIDRPMLWRTGKSVLWLLLIGILANVIMSGIAILAFKVLGKITATIAITTFLLIIILALLPLNFIMMKYVLTPKSSFLKLIGTAYVIGIRHLSSIFIVTLIVTIITTLLTLVVQLPANILYIANLQSQLGALQGDPFGMPEYMGKMNYVVFALMGFLQGYIHLSTLFPYYFLYGSIEKQEEERKQLRIKH